MTESRKRRVRFGLAIDYFDPRASLTETLNTIESLAGTAFEAGFDILYHPHHFLDADSPRLQSLPTLSFLAPSVPGMLLVWAELLPLNHPIRVAEQLATLDVLANGHTVLLGVLGYQRNEFRALGVEFADRSQLLSESYEIICRLLGGETVHWHSSHYQLDGVQLGGMLRPVSSPRPGVWVTAHNRAGIRRAALYGDSWLISHQPRLAELIDGVALYREHRAVRIAESFQTHESHDITLPMMREAFVAQSTQDALGLARQPMMDSVGEYLRSDQLDALEDADSYATPFDTWRIDRAVIGDPLDVAQELSRYVDALGVDCFILKLHRHGIDLDRVHEAIRLVGSDVIPTFENDVTAVAG